MAMLDHVIRPHLGRVGNNEYRYCGDGDMAEAIHDACEGRFF